MTQFHKNTNSIEKLLKNKQYEQVIEKCIQLYVAQSNDIIYLNYILKAYKENTLYDKNIGANAIEDFKKLLIHTSVHSIQYCILHNEIGIYYVNSNDHKMAISHFKKVLTVKKDMPDVYNNIAICHNVLQEYDKSRINLRISLQFKPDDNIYQRLGKLNFITKRYDESIKDYESIRNPSSYDIYNLSFAYLAKKQFLHGYKLYENRLVCNDICFQTNQLMRAEIPSIQYWNGIDVCHNLIIIYEQGIGDNIQYFRFIIELASNFPQIKITYFCKSNISHIFNTELYENIIICDDSKPIDISIYDKKLYIMSLPYILKLEKITPNPINYINDDVNNNSYWKTKLTTFDNKLKVGFVYSGLLISYIDKYIQLHDFRDICNDNRFQTFCIHQNDKTISSDFLNIDFADKIIRYDNFDTTKSFLDTISLLRNIDILVTIDTSTAHIAGVMGVKTLLLIGYTSEWRWFDTDDKVWYESIQIIRMNQQKPLAELLPRIKNILIMEYENKYLT